MIVVALFFSLCVVLSMILTLLELAAHANHPAPSTQPLPGCGLAALLASGLFAIVFWLGVWYSAVAG